MKNTAREMTSSVGLLILRLGIGGYMLTHGWGKLQLLLDGQFDAIGDPIGLGETASLVLIVFAEFVCAILVLAGFLTRLAAFPLVVAMAVAAFVAHADDPWTMARAAQLYTAGEADSWASRQPALMYLTAFLALIFTGAGRFSVDGLIWPGRRRREETPAAE